jgi:electron transport complex protein RnfE
MTLGEVMRNGLRDNNPGLVQLLGLCPLLAISTSVANALGLGIATLGVLVVSNLAASLLGPSLPREIRIAAFVIVIAASVSTVELAMAGWWPGLHASLGIFLPLIVTNCLVLARADAFASRQSVAKALADGLAMGLGFLWVLLLLGALRELAGHGTLGAGLDLLTGRGQGSGGWRLFAESHGNLIALLPPGAFVMLGLLLALGRVAGAVRHTPAVSAAPDAEASLT